MRKLTQLATLAVAFAIALALPAVATVQNAPTEPTACAPQLDLASLEEAPLTPATPAVDPAQSQALQMSGSSCLDDCRKQYEECLVVCGNPKVQCLISCETQLCICQDYCGYPCS